MRRYLTLLLPFLMLNLAGCVAFRGSDFGHWARLADYIPLIQARLPSGPSTNAVHNVLLLTPLGGGSESERKIIGETLYQELRTRLGPTSLALDDKDPVNRYVNSANLLDGDTPRTDEIVRLGSMAGASHVVCMTVRDWHPYPPQRLNARLFIVDVSARSLAVEVDACLDAAEQQVVMALGEYLQERRAMPFEKYSLQIILQSPSEFLRFATSVCSVPLNQFLNARQARTDKRKGAVAL